MASRFAVGFWAKRMDLLAIKLIWSDVAD